MGEVGGVLVVPCICATEAATRDVFDEMSSSHGREAAKFLVLHSMEFQHLHALSNAQPWTAPRQTFGQHKSCSRVLAERGKFLHRSISTSDRHSPPSTALVVRRSPVETVTAASEFGVQTKRCPGRSTQARGKIVIATWIAVGDRPRHPVSIQPLSSSRIDGGALRTQETTPSATRSITRSLAAKKSAGRRMVKS